MISAEIPARLHVEGGGYFNPLAPCVIDHLPKSDEEKNLHCEFPSPSYILYLPSPNWMKFLNNSRTASNLSTKFWPC